MFFKDVILVYIMILEEGMEERVWSNENGWRKRWGFKYLKRELFKIVWVELRYSLEGSISNSSPTLICE